ncbi:blue (type 1) copper domain protein [Haloterrigena salina JCM 13891]|uniref:Blue (Type 1) copper domain protein n=1 Tax=Haloterrigena salina JCM 13891 TaxID=1227488 RepID=M0C1E3_9EURY|nr:plastocyanin/azurin family copper-binding protein [Haloterrigena salina]ELZ16162.1 blue (type 1) copper domain protein [Haloterrigena salina JCM 13891]
MLRLGGSTAVAALLAGCGGGGGPGGNGDEENQSGNGEEGTNESAGSNETNETEGGNETNESEGGNETNESEGGNETNESEGGGGSGVLEPGEIGLGGETQAWQGAIPEQIAGEENPTLTLQEGEAYEITWENLDGAGHNIQILDDNDEVVDDYETEIMSEEGETQTLSIDEVTSEMAQYICEPHQATMNGDIEVQ